MSLDDGLPAACKPAVPSSRIPGLVEQVRASAGGHALSREMALPMLTFFETVLSGSELALSRGAGSAARGSAE